MISQQENPPVVISFTNSGLQYEASLLSEEGTHSKAVGVVEANPRLLLAQ